MAWGHCLDAWGYRMDVKALPGNRRLEPMTLLARLRLCQDQYHCHQYQPDSGWYRCLSLWTAARVACACVPHRASACQAVKMLSNTIHSLYYRLHTARGATRKGTVSEGCQQHFALFYGHSV